MPELAFATAMALVATAEKRFDAKDYDGSATALCGVLEAQPTNHWALLAMAWARREQGAIAAATQRLLAAIALPVPERIGAYFDLGFHLLAEQEPGAAARRHARRRAYASCT